MAPDGCQTITCNNTASLTAGSLGINLSEIWMKIHVQYACTWKCIWKFRMQNINHFTLLSFIRGNHWWLVDLHHIWPAMQNDSISLKKFFDLSAYFCVVTRKKSLYKPGSASDYQAWKRPADFLYDISDDRQVIGSCSDSRIQVPWVQVKLLPRKIVWFQVCAQPMRDSVTL